MMCPFNQKLTLIASIGARQRHGTDDHELPGRGTMQGIDGLQGPFPRGYAFHFPVPARQSQIYRPIKNSWLDGKDSWKWNRPKEHTWISVSVIESRLTLA